MLLNLFFDIIVIKINNCFIIIKMNKIVIFCYCIFSNNYLLVKKKYI